MTDHRPVATSFTDDRGTSVVYFHCPCMATRRLVATNTDIHPVARFTAALRRRHERGEWPGDDIDLGDADAAGWGADPDSLDEPAERVTGPEVVVSW